ncbi:MAG: lipopolysaccharide kinase InaA family protein [Planctomycetes bacterium]|nr:lipopolysaccharide kinase InaA family protein [Planctomycetota bacterium]
MLHADFIRTDPAYRATLHARGLDDVSEFLTRVAGRVAAWSRTTDTLHVPGADGEPGFYLKRYFYPRWRNRLRGMLRGTFFGAHRGQAEYRALNTMLALGISAVRPVAFGSRRVGNFVTACFLITEEVPGACNLTTFARDALTGRQSVTRPQRLAMVRRLAAQVAVMHASRFAHGQLFWRNVLVRTGPDGTPEFFFLDAQPPRRWPFLSRNGHWWLRELSHLATSAIPFTTRTERLRFLLAYFNARRLTPEIKAHTREIERQAQRWRRHELRRIKMNDLFEEWNRQLATDQAQTAAKRPGPGRRDLAGDGTPEDIS